MGTPEILVRLSSETVEEKIRNKFTIVYGWGRLIDEEGDCLLKEELLYGQSAIKKATIKLGELFERYYIQKSDNDRNPESSL